MSPPFSVNFNMVNSFLRVNKFANVPNFHLRDSREPGSDMLGHARICSDMLGQARTGSDMLGHARTGSDMLNLDLSTRKTLSAISANERDSVKKEQVPIFAKT